MKPGWKNASFAVAVVALIAVAAIMWRNQLHPPKPAPTGPGFIEGWFACKAYPGWLCLEDGSMKPDPNWIGPRADPKKRGTPPPRGPER